MSYEYRARRGFFARREESTQIGEVLLWALSASNTVRQQRPLPAVAPHEETALVAAALAHGVAPQLFQSLHEAGTLRAFGETTMAQLHTSRGYVLAQHLRVMAELPQVAACFQGARIDWAVLKGPVVAQLGYRDPSLRGYADLDILVAPKWFGDAIDALCEAGARLLDVNWELQLQLWRSEATLVLPHGTVLDLHWHPLNDGSARAGCRLDIAAMLERTRPVLLDGGVAVRALDSIDNLLSVALHAAFSGGHRLVWIKDLERLVHTDAPDWAMLANRAIGAGLAPSTAIMLRRATRLLGAAVPPSVIARLVAAQPWVGAVLPAEVLATPASIAAGTRTGRAVISSLRASAAATGLAIAKESVRHYYARPVADIVGHHPLRVNVGGPRARRAYLEAVKAYHS